VKNVVEAISFSPKWRKKIAQQTKAWRILRPADSGTNDADCPPPQTGGHGKKAMSISFGALNQGGSFTR